MKDRKAYVGEYRDRMNVDVRRTLALVLEMSAHDIERYRFPLKYSDII